MVVEVRNLRKGFGKKEVLRDVSLSVAEGEVVGLAGPNGAGKSTLIDVLMGFQTADSGEIRVLGTRPGTRSHLAQVAWMPERPAFPAGWTAGRVLEFQRSTAPRWDEPLAASLQERLGLHGDLAVDRLSRGEIGRLSLLCSLATRPRLLLLDDPTLGLDPSGRRLLMGEILSCVADGGAAALVSTHLVGELAPALDRLLILRGSRIVVDEPVDALRERCRLLRFPREAPAPPTELDLLETAHGLMSTRFDREIWEAYCDSVPGALAEPVDLETIYSGLTQEGGA